MYVCVCMYLYMYAQTYAYTKMFCKILVTSAANKVEYEYMNSK